MIGDYELKVGYEMNESHLTPELTGREASASCDKFSMRSKLIPLRLNELLCRESPESRADVFYCDGLILMSTLLLATPRRLTLTQISPPVVSSLGSLIFT